MSITIREFFSKCVDSQSIENYKTDGRKVELSFLWDCKDGLTQHSFLKKIVSIIDIERIGAAIRKHIEYFEIQIKVK